MTTTVAVLHEMDGRVFEVKPGEADPIVIVAVEQTCGACPSQWQAKTDDGRDVYARYRSGCGYVSVGRRTDDNQFGDMPGDGGAIVCSYLRTDPDGEWDGVLNLAELQQITKGFVEWRGL